MAINPKIKQKAEDIRSKIFGSEVRESLASGIEAISEDVEATIGRQDYVEEQFQDVLDETTGKDVISAPELIAARNGKSNLKTRLDGEHAQVTAQLQQTKNFHDYEIQNKTRNTQALFTIQDDDGRVEVLSMLEPLRAEFNIPMSAAIIPQWVGGYGFMTKEQIVDLASKGWEIVSHTSNHEKLNELSYEAQDDTMKRSVDTLKSWGIDVTSIAYPYGRRNDNTVKSARKYFRSGRSTDIGINRPPLQTWDTLALNGEGGDSSLAAIKARIDDIALNGGWGIYVTHAGLDNNVPAANAREVIEYVLSKGNIEIVSYNEALNRMGNIIDNGRYWEKDLTKPHGVMGADGTIRSNEMMSQIVTTEDGVTSATPPNAFKLGKQYTTRILYTNRLGFPEDKHGTLVTKLTTATHWNEYVTQEYYPLNSYVAYRRYATSPTEWSAWKDQNFAYKLATKPSFDSPPSFFPHGVSFYPVAYVDRAGFPDNASGALITYRIEGYLWQIYQINGRNTQYMRTQNQVNYGWNVWKRITPHATTSGDMKNMDVAFINGGDLVYNTSLNKPLWRNSANTGWVDATGTAVVL